MLSYLVGVTEQMAARWIAAVMTALIGVSSVHAQQLLDIPGDPQLGHAVRTFRSGFVQTEVIRLRMSGQLGCAQHCATITRAFDRIHRAARLQAPGMRNLKLVVTRDPTVDAWASATGHIFISEKFITRLGLTEPEIALALGLWQGLDFADHLHPGSEEAFAQGAPDSTFCKLRVLVEELEILAEVEDQKVILVPTRAKQVRP